MPLACPVSVPPVTLIAHPLADLSVWMPWIELRLTCSNDVQVGLLRSLQPPLDDHVIPDERSRLVASPWLSLVTSQAHPAVPSAYVAGVRWARETNALGLLLGLLAVIKIVDMGFFAALDRRFDPVFDWSFFPPAVDFLTGAIGRVGAIGSVVAAVVVAVAVVILVALSILRLTRLVAGHRTAATRAVDSRAEARSRT